MSRMTGSGLGQLWSRAVIAGVRRVSPWIGHLKDLPRPVLHLSLGNDGRFVPYLVLALSRVGALSFDDRTLGFVASALSPSDLARATLYTRRARNFPVDVLISDKPDEITARLGRRYIQLSYDYFDRDSSSQTLTAPYSFHPAFYCSGLYRRVRFLRRGPRSARILFAGTMNDAAYRKSFLFGMLSRSDVLATLFDAFRSEMCVVRDAAALRLAANTKRAVIVSITEDPSNNLAKHPLSQSDYLKQLSHADFFLCPPGWQMPLCHNLIEAMSVGAIPILNYGEWLSPPLKDGEECLAFETRNDLVEAVRKALRMDNTEIARMRNMVLRYFDDILSVEGFGGRLGQWLASSSSRSLLLRVNSEGESARLFQRTRS